MKSDNDVVMIHGSQKTKSYGNVDDYCTFSYQNFDLLWPSNGGGGGLFRSDCLSLGHGKSGVKQCNYTCTFSSILLRVNS